MIRCPANVSGKCTSPLTCLGWQECRRDHLGQTQQLLVRCEICGGDNVACDACENSGVVIVEACVIDIDMAPALGGDTVFNTVRAAADAGLIDVKNPLDADLYGPDMHDAIAQLQRKLGTQS